MLVQQFELGKKEFVISSETPEYPVQKVILFH